MTLAFVTVVLNEDWFPLQSAMLVSEQILTYVTDTYRNQSPPLSFLVGAWASTTQYWSQQIRVNSQPPKLVMGAVGAWEHKWKWTPSEADNGSSGSQGGGSARPMSREPDNKALKNEVDTLKGQVKRFQQAADRMYRSEAPWNQSNDAPERENKRARGSGGGKDGKKGKGKGGNGSKGKDTGSRWRKNRRD